MFMCVQVCGEARGQPQVLFLGNAVTLTFETGPLTVLELPGWPGSPKYSPVFDFPALGFLESTTAWPF